MGKNFLTSQRTWYTVKLVNAFMCLKFFNPAAEYLILHSSIVSIMNDDTDDVLLIL